jgi:hypothetical protein
LSLFLKGDTQTAMMELHSKGWPPYKPLS